VIGYAGKVSPPMDLRTSLDALTTSLDLAQLESSG